MISQIPINLFRFMLLLMAQVMVFSNIQVSPFINLYIFPLFVLLLPFETLRWLLMVLGMAAGLVLDFFLGSMGMHAAAGLLLGYVRPLVISVITPKGSEFEISPNIFAQGPTWFLIYTSVAGLIYLGFYFLIEAGTFHNFLWLLLRIFSSTVLSVLLMIVFLFILSSKKKRRFA